MDAYFLIVGKFLLSSVLLMALYWFLLRNRASYRLSRAFLITLPLLSAMMSGLTFEVTLPSGLIDDDNIRPIREVVVPQSQLMPKEFRLFDQTATQTAEEAKGSSM